MKKLCYIFILMYIFVSEVHSQSHKIYASSKGNLDYSETKNEPINNIHRALDQVQVLRKENPAIPIEENSVLSNSPILIGDAIISGEGQEINSIPDLMNVYEGHNWKGKINLVIFRNQQEKTLILKTR
ncbi:hypothetical protein [Urechidicola vernalis]|uniref:PDZ domain-containing protein n=1 Tax=Urechidicola vernalis TaxID=3075600 RepID=A0ABU2Y616_9FLAO|nr:hypothetical protein [Urechidicola sp. P050]MDT0553064.1 hypothetical protein [Urechidicola sp. P050]